MAGGRRRRPGVVDAAAERGRPRRARCRAGHGEEEEHRSPRARAPGLPARRPGRQARRRRRRPARRPRLRPHRGPGRRALQRRGPHAPVLGHRAASRRALGAEQARPRAGRRHGPGQDDRRPDRARQRARRHRARLPHRRVRPGGPALPAHGPHGRPLLRRQRGGDPQPTRARVSPPGGRAVRPAALRHTRRASRGRRGVLLGAGLHRARGAAVRALHPPVHPRLAAPPRRPPAEPHCP